MDIGASEITDVIVASTTSYLVEYSSIFLMVGGLVLALAVIGGLVDLFTGQKYTEKENMVQ